jgi:hypothetical protein
MAGKDGKGPPKIGDFPSIAGTQRLPYWTQVEFPFIDGLGAIDSNGHLTGCSYMIGETGIGDSLARGWAYGKANVQTILQLTGGREETGCQVCRERKEEHHGAKDLIHGIRSVLLRRTLGLGFGHEDRGKI